MENIAIRLKWCGRFVKPTGCNRRRSPMGWGAPGSHQRTWEENDFFRLFF